MTALGEHIAVRRKKLRLSQSELARKASLSRATLDALENGRAGELGFSKVAKLLSALRLELKVQDAAAHRPTLDDLIEEDRNDQSVGRRR